MRARAAAGPLRPTACQYARTRFTVAQAFLTWAAAADTRPSALTQAHIDAYVNSCRAYQRLAVRAFLTWAAEHGHIPAHLDIPREKYATGQAITQKRRLELLRRFATDTAVPLRPRAAACIMLLYAQPLTRILRLTAGDLTRDGDGRTWLNLGDPPSPSRARSTTCSTSSPAPAMTTFRPTAPAAGCSPAARPGSPPNTRVWPSSSATSACPCAPHASPPCASSSSRSPPPSSPTHSDSTTPPPHASTSTPAPPGANTPAETTTLTALGAAAYPGAWDYPAACPGNGGNGRRGLGNIRAGPPQRCILPLAARRVALRLPGGGPARRSRS